jgi:putative acetyltransferase
LRATPLELRTEKPADRDAIAAVVSAAFKSPVEAQLVDAIRGSENFVAAWSVVACIGEEIVGHVLCSYATLRAHSAARRIVTLSPLAVAPDHQGVGTGGALVRAVAARVDDAGEPLIVLEGSPQYYGRFGFEAASPLGINISLPEWAPPEAAQVLRLRTYSPDIRGDIVYPPAFDAVTHDRGDA